MVSILFKLQVATVNLFCVSDTFVFISTEATLEFYI